MTIRWTAAALGLALVGSIASVSAQPYGGGGYGPRERGPDLERRDYDRDRGGSSYGRDRVGFDEREYLRCNPDVRRAVNNGQMASAAAHWRTFGRREGRRLTC